MKSNVKLSTYISSLLVAFFFLFLSFFAIFAELFKTQIQELDIAQIYVNPISINDLSRLRVFSLKNKNGEFIFENTHPEGFLQGPWQMTYPQILRLKENIMERMMSGLKNLKIRNLHLYEPINVSSFSIDNPTFEMTLIGENQKKIEIKQGLINPIDDSSYLGISGQDHIYQVDLLGPSLDNFDLAQLADSRVFALHQESLSSLEFFHEKKGSTLTLIKKDDHWTGADSEKLSTEKVHELLDAIENVKSRSILSNLSEDQSKILQNIFMEPMWSIKILHPANVKTYILAKLPPQFPGIGTSLGGAYVLTNNEKQSFILIHPKELAFLELTEKKMR